VGHQLNTHGPYLYIRHPAYTAGMIFFVSMARATGSWLLLMVMALAFPLLLARTPLEETELLGHFGDD
jgi:protein-S-isoprenylcysteine O-methyltransferase Ste14